MDTINIKNLDREVKMLVSAYNHGIVEALKTKKLMSFLKDTNVYRAVTKTTLNNKIKFADWLLDSWMEASEQTRFGDVLERVVYYIARQDRKGFTVLPHNLEGIDLVILVDDDKVIDIIQVKSGHNWSNKDSLRQMVLNMRAAEDNLHALLTKGWSCRYVNLVVGNGTESSVKNDHIKLCRADTFEYLTGIKDFDLTVFESFQKAKDSKVENLLYNATKDCRKRLYTEMDDFMLPKGNVDWKAILRHVGGK